MSAGHAHIAHDTHGIATLTITDATALNILGTSAVEDLREAMSQLATRTDVRALVLRGSGDKAFIGGADIREMSGMTAASAEIFIRRLKDLCDSLRTFPVPVIARLSGWCLGAGLEVVMACDLRYGDTTARLGMPEVKLGIPSVIHSALMPRLIGQSRTAWMLLTGEAVDAETALAWGLLHSVSTLDQLDQVVVSAARKLAALNPDVLQQQKRMLRSWESMELDEAIALSIAEFAKVFATAEPRLLMEDFMRRGSAEGRASKTPGSGSS